MYIFSVEIHIFLAIILIITMYVFVKSNAILTRDTLVGLVLKKVQCTRHDVIFFAFALLLLIPLR